MSVQVQPNRTGIDQEVKHSGLWVAVTAETSELASGDAARAIALGYVARKFGTTEGIDAVEGPRLDDGSSVASRAHPKGGYAPPPPDSGVTTAQDYLKMAAEMAVAAAQPGRKGYVCFFRVRRGVDLASAAVSSTHTGV